MTDPACDLTHPEPETAFSAKDQAEAEIVRALFEGAGIPAFLVTEALTTSAGVPVPPASGGIEVRVPCSRADEARELLANAREAGKLLSSD